MKYSDRDIIAALEAEEALAQDSSSGELAKERADALDRYRGAPLGNEVEGRSQVVDRSIMDTIEWIMPSLVRVYLGGDEIGKFEPRGPEDEEAAQIETDVINWYLENKNDFFAQINAALRDALLLKNGYMVGQWATKTDIVTEKYIGKCDEELALLMQDQDVQVVEHNEYPDPVNPGYMLHDVTLERKKPDEFVQTDSIPPDELIVSRRHRDTSLLNCDFVEWVRRVTIGQLREEGFEISDDEPGDDPQTLEHTSRDRFRDANPYLFNEDATNDPSRRLVTFRDAYIRMDLEGKGTPKLWRIARVSGSEKIALKEEADIIPFAAFSPLLYPHSHVGTSVYDLIADLGIIKTVLQRQALDGGYLQQSGRMAVNVNNVNLDDLLTAKPGGVVRVDGMPGENLFPIQTPDTTASTLGLLEFIEGQKEGRTGVTRYSAGLDANSLNKTATGVQAIQNAANQRIELIARTLASGFKDLFLIAHALVSKHCTKPLQIKLRGKWVPVDPREWVKRTDFSISVGLGTGTPEQQLQKLLGLSPVFQQGMQMGLAGPMEAYNFGKEIWKAAGYKNPDRFIKAPPVDPQTGEPQSPPPQKDPLVQAEEVKGQFALQAKQIEGQAKGQELQMKAQAESAKMAQDAQMKQFEIEKQAELERFKVEQQMILERYKAELQAQTDLQKEELKAQYTVQAAQAGKPETYMKPDPQDAEDDAQEKAQMRQMLEQLGQMMAMIQEDINAPSEIIRGPDGRAAGVKKGNRVREILRGPDGRAMGVQ